MYLSSSPEAPHAGSHGGRTEAAGRLLAIYPDAPAKPAGVADGDVLRFVVQRRIFTAMEMSACRSTYTWQMPFLNAPAREWAAVIHDPADEGVLPRG